MTAFTTGTVTSHTDLWAKLHSFLTTNDDLVAAGEAWSQVWAANDQIVLRGPGLSGDDRCYVGLRTAFDPLTDSYSIMMRGMAGVLPGATDIGGHVSVSNEVGIYTDSQPHTYWFVASGRRFVVVLKISTVFEAMYGGLFLPYAVPDSYPYPMFVGGSRGNNPSSPVSWRNTAEDHTHFVSPHFQTNPVRDSCAWMMSPSGEWMRCWNRGGDPGNPVIGMAPEHMFGGYNVDQNGSRGYGYNYVRGMMRGGFDGSFPLLDITMVQTVPADQSHGILDGCYRVPGNTNSSENIITAGGVDHLVVQNCFRTGVWEYWALALG